MTSPAFEVQAKVVQILKADAAVMAEVSGIYDTVPTSPWGTKEAYISLGPMDAVIDDADCIDGEEQSLQLDVWTRSGGKAKCKRACDAIKRALHQIDLDLVDNAVGEINLELYRILDDPDGLTKHGVLQFRVSVEIPS